MAKKRGSTKWERRSRDEFYRKIRTISEVIETKYVGYLITTLLCTQKQVFLTNVTRILENKFNMFGNI